MTQKKISPERQAFKEKTLKEKFQFYWKYLKGHVIFWIIAAVVLIYMLINTITAPVISLNGMMLNTGNGEKNQSVEQLIEKYIADEKLEIAPRNIVINDKLSYIPGDKSKDSPNLESSMAILAQKEENQLDFIAGPLSAVENLAYNAFFVNLKQILSEEQIAAYEPYFLYVDQTVIVELNEAFNEEKDISKIPIPDSTKPEEMEKPVPVMIDISKCEALSKVYKSAKEPLVFGVINGTPEQENTLQFLDYLMQLGE